MSAAHDIIARLRVDGASQYTDDMEGAADATEEFGDTTEEVVERTSGVWDTLSENVNKISGVLAGVGAFSEGFARTQQESNQTLERSAIATGMQTDELRDLAVGMSDHTFATEDAIAGMERLIQSGHGTAEEFKAILPAVDDLADATGQDFIAAMDSAERILRPLGESLEDVEGNGDQLTRMLNETNIPLSTLERNLGRVPDELQDLEFGLDDAAAGIEVFRDRGFSGQEAVREFRRAVADSEGDMDALLEGLGLTAEEFDEYRAAVEPVPGLMGNTAERMNDTMTPMQRLQSNLQNTMARFGGFTDVAGQLAPVAMGAASGLQLLSRTKGVAAVATRGLSTAMAFLAANPMVLVIGGIAALVAAGVWLWKNWDQVTEWISGAWAWLSERITGIVDTLRDGPLGGLITAMEILWEAWSNIFDWIMEKVNDVFGDEGFVGTIKGAVNAVIGVINGAINALNNVSITLPTVPDWVPGLGGSGGQEIGFPQIPTIPTLNRGGLVPGGGPNRDTTLAALTPGEWVLNRDATQAIGTDTLQVMNRLDRSSTTPTAGGGDVHVTVAVQGDVLDPEDWFRRNRRAMAESVGRAVADARASR